MKNLKLLPIAFLMAIVSIGISCQKDSVRENIENTKPTTSKAPQLKAGYFLVDIPESGYEDYFTSNPNGELTEHYLEVGNSTDSLPLEGVLYFEMDEDFKVTKLGCTENIAQALGLQTNLLNSHELTNDFLNLLEGTIGGVDPPGRPSGFWGWVKYIFWGEPGHNPCYPGQGMTNCFVQHWTGLVHGTHECPCP